jgi:glycosyltransferase involved in cell wall biosynthesis
MITIGYSTRESNPKLKEYFIKSSGFKKNLVIEKVNNGEKSLSEIYNEILREATTDIVVLCHDDITFDTSAWYPKLINHFNNSDFGILGVAGTTHMPESGQWWQNRRKMYGIVNHQQGTKKWESKYSEPFGNDIKPVVVVDGLFIAIHKKRIRKNFNEDFKGFHFYDIPFCFENYLEGVKVGVITNIRITHQSIGMTNEKWESNRQLFIQKYSSNLPQKILFDREKDKINVLLSCLNFRTFTGSELYVYELARGLKKLNCEVTVMSQIGGPLTDLARKNGIKCLSFEQAPGFKLGDGKWGFDDGNGYKVSQVNMMYRVSEVNFDIIHIQHKPVAERILNFYPEIDKICSIHSEIIELENPMIHPSIKKYIAIRPEIKDYLITKFQISENDIEIIYNPIDESKFTKSELDESGYVLFVGTLDYLRRETLMDLIEYTQKIGKELWIVGENKGNFLDALQRESNVKYFPATWNIEKYLKGCSETAGIQLGRTTIEGWLSGKPGWIYKVDSLGVITSKEKFDPPSDIEKYFTTNVAKQIKEEYIKIIS